jgi:outer membrane protein assembly factor BamB
VNWISCKRWSTPRLLAASLSIVAGLSLAQSGHAQDSPAPVTAPDPAASPADEAVPLRLLFERDREVELRLAQAQSALGRQEWASFASAADEILSATPHTMVRLPGQRATFRPAREEVRRLLKTAPAAAQQAFAELVRPTAQQELTAALQTGDSRALQRISERYPLTPAGQSALEQLAAIAWQRGQINRAAACLQQLIFDHPRPAQLLRARPELALNYDRCLAENPARAEEFWSEYGTPLEQLRLPQGETVLTARTRLSARPPALLADSRPMGLPLSTVPTWQTEFQYSDSVLQEISAGLRDLAEHGLRPAPAWRGCRAAGHWIISHPTGLTAIDPADGAVHWFLPHSWNTATRYAAEAIPDDEVQRRLFRWELLVRMHGEVTFNWVETDGERIFYIVPEHPAGLFQLPVQGQAQPFPAQSLICRRADNAEFLWSSQGGAFAPAYFAGPPIVDGPLLHLLIETQQDRHFLLMSLETSTGAVASVNELFQPAQSIDDDFRRTNRAGVALPLKDYLLCATCAGGLVAVDRTSRELRWAYQYPRDDLPRLARRFQDPQHDHLQYHNWRSWREVQVIPVPGGADQDEQVLFVTPDSRSVHLLNLRDGAAVWMQPLPEGQQLLGVHGASVYVLERRHLVELNLRNGSIVQRLRVPEACGKAVLLGPTAVYLDVSGHLVHCDLPTGTSSTSPTSLRSTTNPDYPPTNLLLLDHAVVGVSHLGIDRLASLTDRLQQLQATGEQTPKALLQQGDLLLQQGDFSAALEVADWLTTAAADDRSLLSAARSLKQQVIFHWTAAAGVTAIPDRALQEFQQTAPAELLLEWQVRRLQRALAEADWSAAAELSQSLWLNPLETHFLQHPLDPIVICRADRLVTALWQAALQSLAPSAREAALATLQQATDELLKDHPEAAASIVERLGQLPPAQLRRLELLSAAGDEAALARTELTLLQQLAHSSGTLRTATWTALQDYDRQRRQIEQWVRLTDRNQSPATPATPTITPPAPEASSAENELFPGWGNSPASVTVKERTSLDIRFAGLPITAPKGSITDRINLELDWPGGQGVQFSAAGLGRPWRLSFGDSGRHLRSEVRLARGWGLGEQLVVQLGTELFGIRPVSAAGSRRATLLWPPRSGPGVDTLGDRSVIMLGFSELQRPQRLGFPGYPSQLVDDYEHEVGAVGPVRPGALIMQQKGMLVALDPATGTELWRRHDLPPLADCLGDDHELVLWSRGTATGQRISLIDGRESGTVSIPQPYEDRLLDRVGRSPADPTGVFVLCSTGERRRFEAHDPLGELAGLPPAGPPYESAPGLPTDPATPAPAPFTLTYWNVLQAEQVWSRSWPAGTLPFQFDQDCLGVFDPAGVLEIVSIQTGESISRAEVPVPPPIQHIVTAVGERTVLVAISGIPTLKTPPDELGAARRGQRTLIHGPLLCFERETGRLLWQIELSNALFDRYQPLDLPVCFVVSPALVESSGPGTIAPAALELYDRRTGQLLHRAEGTAPQWNFLSISGSLPDRQVRVKTNFRLFEIDFPEVQLEVEQQR